jgi:hypothetical protein
LGASHPARIADRRGAVDAVDAALTTVLGYEYVAFARIVEVNNPSMHASLLTAVILSKEQVMSGRIFELGAISQETKGYTTSNSFDGMAPLGGKWASFVIRRD